MTTSIKSETAPPYITPPPPTSEASTPKEPEVIAHALRILEGRLVRPDQFILNPQDVKDFLVLQLAEEPREVFCALFLNQAHGLLSFEKLATGTLDTCTVHPREVAIRALHHNAAAVIFAHNHPSNRTAPSTSDDTITTRLREALKLLNIRTLDHIIVGGTTTYSYAEALRIQDPLSTYPTSPSGDSS